MAPRDRDGAGIVLEAVRTAGLLAADQPVVVMVSGGRDSVCLLDVAARVAGPASVSAVHVNYGLRAAAEDEQRHCEALCAGLGVGLTVHRAGAPGAGNLHAWARDLRYRVARRLAAASGARVAVAHTASDQAETVLYRLAASPGRRALLGMAPQEGDLVRPLLQFTREQTTAYCIAAGLEWRDDSSNHDHAYARARVRDELLAALRSIHPAAEANVVRTASLLRDESAVLDGAVEAVLEGRASVELARLATLPVALRRLVVRRLAEDAGGGLAPAAAARIDEILALGRRPGSATLDLGDGIRALVEYGRLRFRFGPEPELAEPVALPVPGSVRFGSFVVSGRHGPVEARDGVLDAGAVAAPLLVRRWRDGDRMAPLGLGGTRSLQDLFTDRRVPRERRRTLPVVESGGQIAWVPGVATGERFRVRPSTRRAVHLDVRDGP